MFIEKKDFRKCIWKNGINLVLRIRDSENVDLKKKEGSCSKDIT